MLNQDLQDMLNAGLGLYRFGEKNAMELIQKLEASFRELVEAGSADQSREAQAIREVLSSSLKEVRETSSRAEKNFNAILEEAGKNYAQFLEQLSTFTREMNIQNYSAKIDELSKSIRNRSTSA